jgi:glycosyltransferase involved in cell wall biosynthesis
MKIFSIIIPTFDRPKLVLRALTSAVLGTPKGTEIIIADDGIKFPFSLDPALVGAGGHDVRVVKTRGAEGPSAARNMGVAASSSALIFFLDDDDELVSDYIGRVIEVLERNPDLKWGYSSVLSIYDNCNPPLILEKKRLQAEKFLNVRSPLGEYICGLGSGFWIIRACYDEVGGLSSQMKMDEDTDLCCCLFTHSCLGYHSSIPGVKIHKAWMETNHAPQITLSASKEKIAEAYFDTFKNNSSILRSNPVMTMHLAKRYLRVAAKVRDGNVKHGFSRIRPEVDSIFSIAFLWMYWRMKVLARQLNELTKGS